MFKYKIRKEKNGSNSQIKIEIKKQGKKAQKIYNMRKTHYQKQKRNRSRRRKTKTKTNSTIRSDNEVTYSK